MIYKLKIVDIVLFVRLVAHRMIPDCLEQLADVEPKS